MTAGKGIPFVDLVAPHLELEEELMDAVRGVLTTGMFVGGPMVEQFEQEFARFSNAKYCVGVSSGTDALRFILMAAGIGKDDIVITVSNTFAATVEAIVQSGSVPHFIDIDPRTFNMSATALRSFLETQCDKPSRGRWPVHRATGRVVKAIMPVHLYGQVCEMDPIVELADQYGLLVFEDACQAHGSDYFSARTNDWQRAGSIGKAAAFSFYPGKNLGACGEAGAVTTNDEDLARRIKMIRDHGQSRKYHHLVEGYNGRLDALQAALLRVKLPFLAEWNAQRRALAAEYNNLLKDIDSVQTPFEPDWSRANYHLYVVVCTKGRDQIQKHLTGSNIATGLHYPVPLHLQPAYAYLGSGEGSLPETEQLAGRILSLPMYPQLQREQQHRVAETLEQFSESQIVGSSIR